MTPNTAYNLLLIDSRVSDIKTILQSLNAKTVGLVIQYDTDTYSSITDAIKIKIQQLQHSVATQTVNQSLQNPVSVCIQAIGILQHNYEAPVYQLVESELKSRLYNVVAAEPQLETWTPFSEFIANLISQYGVATLDLMACALYSNINWKYVIDTLSMRLGITIRASVNNTGAIELGGNWILEPSGINLTTVYFTNEIYKWKYILAILPNYFVLRSGGTNWRSYVPLIKADTTTNIMAWSEDAQFNEYVDGSNEIAKQFSYFAGYWLNQINATVSTVYTVDAYYSNYSSAGFRGRFSFKATSLKSDGSVNTYQGSLSSYNGGTYYTLSVQSDGLQAGLIKLPIAKYDTSSSASYTLSGNNVTKWNDLTGNSYHLTNNGTGPTVTPIGGSLNAFNFNPNYGLICSTVPLSKTITIFMVIRYSSDIGIWGNFMHHGNRDTDWSLERNSDSSYMQFQSDNDNTYCQISVAGNTNYIIAGRISGNNRDFWMYSDTTKSTTYSSTTGVTITETTSSTIYVGKSNSSEACNSIIAEIIYYSVPLETTVITETITSLKNKWFKQQTATLTASQTIFYQKFVSGATLSFDVISSNAGTVSRTHQSNNTSIVSIPSSSIPSATVVAIGRTTIKVTQPATTDYTEIIENNLITIVIIGQGQTYTSENMTNTDLSNTNLNGSVFSSCNLTNANLFGTTVNSSTNFSTATLTNVRSGRITGTTTLLPSEFRMI